MTQIRGESRDPEDGKVNSKIKTKKNLHWIYLLLEEATQLLSLHHRGGKLHLEGIIWWGITYCCQASSLVSSHSCPVRGATGFALRPKQKADKESKPKRHLVLSYRLENWVLLLLNFGSRRFFALDEHFNGARNATILILIKSCLVFLPRHPIPSGVLGLDEADQPHASWRHKNAQQHYSVRSLGRRFH